MKVTVLRRVMTGRSSLPISKTRYTKKKNKKQPSTHVSEIEKPFYGPPSIKNYEENSSGNLDYAAGIQCIV